MDTEEFRTIEEYYIERDPDDPTRSLKIGEEPELRGKAALYNLGGRGGSAGYTKEARKRKEEYSEHADYLDCVCGEQPSVFHATYTKEWRVYCRKCHVGTDWTPFLDHARIDWNMHNRHGEKNVGIYDKTKHGIGLHAKYNIDVGLNKIREKKFKVRQTKEDTLRLFYYVDDTYMEKIHEFLKIGMEFESYKDLCDYLNEEIEEGQSAGFTAHKKWWKRFFVILKIRNTLIRIVNIYENYLPWSGNPDVPNQGRTMRSYMPKKISGEDHFGYKEYKLKEGLSPEERRIADNSMRNKEILRRGAARRELAEQEKLKKIKKIQKELPPEENEDDIDVIDYSIYNKQLLKKIKRKRGDEAHDDVFTINDEKLLFADNLDDLLYDTDDEEG